MSCLALRNQRNCPYTMPWAERSTRSESSSRVCYRDMALPPTTWQTQRLLFGLLVGQTIMTAPFARRSSTAKGRVTLRNWALWPEVDATQRGARRRAVDPGGLGGLPFYYFRTRSWSTTFVTPSVSRANRTARS